MFDSNPIPTILKNSLQRAGISQREAARLMGLSPQYLHDIIAGNRRLTPEIASLWAKFVEPTEKELFRAALNGLGAAQDGWDMDAIYEAWKGEEKAGVAP